MERLRLSQKTQITEKSHFFQGDSKRTKDHLCEVLG
jgi:hypothetical protein